MTTPGHRVPSHGTDLLGQRYAYDFFQIDWRQSSGFKFYKTNTLAHYLFGVKLEDTYCWSQSIYAPFHGEIIEAVDGWPERNPVHFVRDYSLAVKNLFTLFALPKGAPNSDLRHMLGNYLILKSRNFYALIAHARQDSIVVSSGDKVEVGQKMAEVGHSGNSSSPHLHFQLMDRPELLLAKGLPCCFKQYETFVNGEWQQVENGVPGLRERIRAVQSGRI